MINALQAVAATTFAPRRSSAGPLLLAVCLGLTTAAAAEDPAPLSAMAEGGAPESYLHFTEQFNARCENLSSGGKMVSVQNLHPKLAVRFRMVRLFADAPQAGRVDGVVLPMAEPSELGCNKVDRRKQRWEIERASLEPVPAPAEAEASPAP
jgi:hypothetical protein